MFFNPNEIASGNVLRFAIENDLVEIVDFPIHSMVMFHRFLYVYQRVYPSISQSYPIIIPANHPY